MERTKVRELKLLISKKLETTTDASTIIMLKNIQKTIMNFPVKYLRITKIYRDIEKIGG